MTLSIDNSDLSPAKQTARANGDDRILQTQISRLISRSGFSNIAGIVMAIIWVGLIWNDLPHEVLSVWLGFMSFLEQGYY